MPQTTLLRGFIAPIQQQFLPAQLLQRGRPPQSCRYSAKSSTPKMYPLQELESAEGRLSSSASHCRRCSSSEKYSYGMLPG